MKPPEPVVTNLELRESNPDGSQAAGLSHTAKGMFLLHVLELAAEGPPRGLVAVLHDAGEHGGRYVGMARTLAGAGWAVSLPDMRGHGESEGERFSLGQHERKDVAAAVDLLVGRGFAPGRIVIVGESMGAAVAVQAVALRPDVAAVVADSAYADGRAIVAEAGPGETGLPDWYTGAIVLAAKVLFGLDAAAVDPAAVVRADTQVPFLFIHCDGDALIDPRHARDLREASANPNTRLWLATGCGHVGASGRYPDEYRSRMIAFLDAQLR